MSGTGAGGAGLRLTWVQPEDLIGHELRQAGEEGREVAGIAARWYAAGGLAAPVRAGASSAPVPRELRALAEELMARIADVPEAADRAEPTDFDGIVAACPAWPGAGAYDGDPVALEARLEAAWRGRAAGCVLGKPVEKLPLDGIRALARAAGNWPLRTWFTARGVPADLLAAYPWNRRSAGNCLAENIAGTPEDDDLDHPVLTVELLLRHGRDFTTADLAALWLEQLPAGKVFTAERVAYANLLRGVEPPETARHRNPFREWIGALIRADVHGWTHPGDPAGAAEQAWRDAVLSHTSNGVYGAMFVAAVLAEATAHGGDAHHCLATGLRVVPRGSRLARAVRAAIALARTHEDFATVVDALHAAHRGTHWVHVVPNAALLAAALTHAALAVEAGTEEDFFTAAVTRTVSGGWDTDSNGATAGSVAGVLHGVPGVWTAPLGNRLRTAVKGSWNDPGGTGADYDTLARLTTGLALAPGAAPDQPARRPASRERVLVRDVPATDGEAPPPTATRSPTP
ncbi:ADP-ribosylglycohydrolase family protein [Streptomyces sp. NEAU-H3]|uniref:ADP-ribosylglycohydrolase family protein n=1 Tax=Streptomyces sp. NEAU-H3 TaxID=2720636 RepID=UPI00143B005C|nr:ADP-ribosylglycohydrolase family protein [Streptomyces sp. NEAU-H3]NJA60033.1 ADP-ribosylglycohydrolase family protein [Streptomyces sp. NEAU-H3]